MIGFDDEEKMDTIIAYCSVCGEEVEVESSSALVICGECFEEEDYNAGEEGEEFML